MKEFLLLAVSVRFVPVGSIYCECNSYTHHDHVICESWWRYAYVMQVNNFCVQSTYVVDFILAMAIADVLTPSTAIHRSFSYLLNYNRNGKRQTNIDSIWFSRFSVGPGYEKRYTSFACCRLEFGEQCDDGDGGQEKANEKTRARSFA